MTAKELAEQLNGRGYGDEIDRATEQAAKAAGLVVVFGASDDLVELRGAINDEIGAYRGTSVFVDAKGLGPDFDQLCEDKNFDALRDYFQRFDGRKEIEAMWDTDGYSWTFKTTIPHETFEIAEDGEPYCRGIVFALADL